MTSTRPACCDARILRIMWWTVCVFLAPGLQVGLVNLLDCVASPTRGTTRTSAQLTCFEARRTVSSTMMRHTTFTRSALVLPTLALVIASATAILHGRQGGGLNQPVKVQGGQVSGVPGKHAGITAFRGVPFAAAPTGNRRWQAPQPPEPWTGVRKAEAFGPSCIQSIAQERKPWTYEFMTHGADQRRLSLRERLDAGQVTVGKEARLRLHLWRGEHRRLRNGPGLRRRRARVEGTRRRQLQLSRRSPRIPRASGAVQGGAVSRVRQLWTARPDRRREVGPREHRRIRRRPDAHHHRRAVGRRAGRPQPHGVPARERSLPSRDHRKLRRRQSAARGFRSRRRAVRRSEGGRDAGGSPRQVVAGHRGPCSGARQRSRWWPRRRQPPLRHRRRRLRSAGDSRRDLRPGQTERCADHHRRQRR